MPEPSLLETLRQEHRPDPFDGGNCAGCWRDAGLTRWPCPVAQLIERIEALERALRKYGVHGPFCTRWGWGGEHIAECKCGLSAALAAYREGTE